MESELRFDDFPVEIVYDALIHAIKTNSGIGFHNHDQGHLVYTDGQTLQGETDAQCTNDSPAKNRMFKLLCQLGAKLGEGANPRIQTWQEFCKLAVNAHDQAQQKKASATVTRD